MTPLDPRDAALFTDLSQVTMAAALWEHGVTQTASFEFSFRALPPGRGFLVAAGLDQAMQHLLSLRFDADQIGFLRRLFTFHNVRPEFWEYLGALRFQGELWAVPEGTPVFPGEPVLRVTAPLVEALLVETFLLSSVAFPSAVASQAARLVEAAQGRDLIDQGARHAQGPGAGLLAARAAYLVGATASSLLEAGQSLGVPLQGSAAHAFVLAFPGEEDAFRAHHAIYPDSSCIVLDTYDAARAARRLAELGLPFRAARIEARDLAGRSREIRDVLDAADLKRVKIVASGDLDEHRIAELAAAQAPIDAFVVGAALVNAPPLEAAYQLVAVDDDGVSRPRLALGSLAASLPGVKQVYRKFGIDGLAKGDRVALATDELTGAPMLELVLAAGKPAKSRPGLETIRDYAVKAIRRLPPGVRALRDAERYAVDVSDSLTALAERLAAEERA